jgi:hypothetical protein
MPSVMHLILKWYEDDVVKMNFIVSTLIALTLIISACTVAGTTWTSSGISPTSTPKTLERPTATPVPLPAPTKSSVNNLTMSCSLLNSQDLANFFTSHTEVMLPEIQINQVEHPIFSVQNAPGTETSCVFYAFHLPGSSAEIMLQVNYWVDVPSQSASRKAWAQEWTQAKSEAGQPTLGIGDDAFFKDGRLTFEKGDLYVTIEATETDLDLKTPLGVEKQAAIEKQIALDMLNRLG